MNTETGRLTAYIDLDAAAANFEMMRGKLKEGTKMCAVIKADAYGHGAAKIAAMVEPFPYIWGFAVAAVEEAIALKESGITKPILILGCLFPEDFEKAIRAGIRMALGDERSAGEMSAAALRLGKEAIVHLAVDTGMSRIGFSSDDEGAALAAMSASLPGIRAEGVFTHFARADEADKTNAMEAWERFSRFMDLLKEKNVNVSIRHCANSAAILELPDVHLDMVRAGISIYGIYPSDEIVREDSPLQNVMTIKSRISAIRTIGPGTSVSYGGLFTAEQPTRVATVPVGYADGYPRSLSCRGSVLINGKRAKILGRVCMDQMMVDVTGLDADLWDEVTLMGKDGDDEITVYELSDASGRFPYEFVCDISTRARRIWTGKGLS